MSVNAISNANPITTAASNYVKQVTATGTTSQTALQEASETPAATAQEAAHGDPVAKRLLAREAQQKQLLNPTPTPSQSSATDNDGDTDGSNGGNGHVDTKG